MTVIQMANWVSMEVAWDDVVAGHMHMHRMIRMYFMSYLSGTGDQYDPINKITRSEHMR